MKGLVLIFLLICLGLSQEIDCSEKAMKEYEKEFFKFEEIEKYLIDINANGIVLDRVRATATMLGLAYGICKAEKELNLKK